METLRRCFHGPPPGGGPVSYSRHRNPRGEAEEEEEEGAEPMVRLPRPRTRPRRRPRPWLHPLAMLALGSATAFLLGLLVAGLGHTPCRGGAVGAGSLPGGSTPELVWGGVSSEAPPPRPRLRELLRRHLRDERVEQWAREVSSGPHGAGSGRGRALAQSVLSALAGAGLSRAWSRPQPLPLPVRGAVSLRWVGPGGEELERLPLDPEAFCAWSAPGTATGGLVYGHYGRPQDLAELRARGVTVRGHLALLRLGRGSPAQQVSAMFAAGALGVLLYPDPRDTAGPGGGPGLGGGHDPHPVQEGAGDPFSRGFPSFRGHAPPGPPPGVPPIPAHPLSAATAMRLMRALGPPLAPPRWGVPGGSLRFRPRPGGRRLQLRVGAGTRPGTLTSVFGALRGRLEPDCYIIVGAQRDSLGPGAAASGMGTALLLELARFFAAIGREGFQLRRTLLFVSWDGAEFGHLGATEWLEGYPDLLHTKVAAYVSLDRPVLGADRFVVRTSPTLGPLIESALEQVESPNEGGKSLLEQLRRPGRGWESDVIRPLPPESGAFPFTAAAGVPALELGFDEAPGVGGSRAALGTPEDTLARLGARLRGRLPAVSRAVAAVAAQLLLRLGHDPRLPLEPAAIGDALVRQLAPLQVGVHRIDQYKPVQTAAIGDALVRQLAPLQARGLSLQCLSSARGGVVRAAAALRRDMSGSDGANERLNRGFNARLMAVSVTCVSPVCHLCVTCVTPVTSVSPLPHLCVTCVTCVSPVSPVSPVPSLSVTSVSLLPHLCVTVPSPVPSRSLPSPRVPSCPHCPPVPLSVCPCPCPCVPVRVSLSLSLSLCPCPCVPAPVPVLTVSLCLSPQAEASLLSPFVSPLVSPFRHILLGRGGHTLAALVAELGTAGDSKGTAGDAILSRVAILSMAAILSWWPSCPGSHLAPPSSCVP
ncbi:LOW QUALITY PROTEIN: transferrin receptor protein 2-like [Agelaius tricolor]|uniref:LOW QUALITY PROTEIN: transferrin receptor protein 2-like n=1 Tax=Agelaius tricolor TaxID=9191 RepID=UPI0039F2183E